MWPWGLMASARALCRADGGGLGSEVGVGTPCSNLGEAAARGRFGEPRTLPAPCGQGAPWAAPGVFTPGLSSQPCGVQGLPPLPRAPPSRPHALPGVP